MKKYLFMVPFVVLLAAGCSGQTATKLQSDNPAPSPSPDQTAPPPTPTNVTPKISGLKPASGAAGIEVTITGQGFTTTGNKIMFADSLGRHHPDCSPANVIATAITVDSKTLSFTVLV